MLQFTLDFVFGWYSPWVAAWRGCRELDRDERATMLEFVTEWLALFDDNDDDDDIRIPSLTILCAQRIAMEIFQKLYKKIDSRFENLD